VPPIDSAAATELSIVLPAGCERTGGACAAGDLAESSPSSVRGDAMKTLVVLVRDGDRAEWILDAGARGSRSGGPLRPAVCRGFTVTSFFILGGPNHLAFVISLLVLHSVRSAPAVHDHRVRSRTR
jgi:hypothetical protein